MKAHSENYELMLRWYDKSHIDYTHYFISVYAAFNAWYREEARTFNDRQALTYLKNPPIIWTEYCKGCCMLGLRLHMEHLVELTQRRPFERQTRYWNGEVNTIYDWSSLLEFWYQVRCLVMHGAKVQAMYIYLAYQTLHIVMGECLKQSTLDIKNKHSYTKHKEDNIREGR